MVKFVGYDIKGTSWAALFRRTFLPCLLVLGVVVTHNNAGSQQTGRSGFMYSRTVSSRIAHAARTPKHAGMAKHRQPKACVVFLMIGGKTSPQGMANTLRQFDNKVSTPLKRKYPAVVVHDGWLTPTIRKTLINAAGLSTVLFQFVNTSDTVWMDQHPDKYQIQDCKYHGRSYRDMNRVFIRLMFEASFIRQFDYWMRLDLDITIDNPIKVDPFRVMHSGDYDFGYVQCLRGWGCNAGLSQFLTSYAAGMNVSDPPFLHDVTSRGVYFYGNVGIGRVAMFTSPQYLRFAQFMDENGGILRHRWDDQHTYAAAIALFSSYARTTAFTFEKLPFHHKGVRLDSKNCY
jgi:Glycolipid 2-alpha-mannosyltransferase